MSNNQQSWRTGNPDLLQGDNYEVGYGKPPKDTRFKEGQSGNPKGRPRKKPSSKELLEKSLNAKVTISEKGEKRSITKLDAFYRSLTTRAIKGDNRAASLLLKLMDQLNVEIPEEEKMTITVTMGGDNEPHEDL